MSYSWNIYNKRLFFSLITILLTLVIVNLIVDPFDIFQIPKIMYFNYLKPEKDRNQRITKMVSLKLEKLPIESVFIGSSRVNSSISEEYYFLKTGKITKNLGMNALSHDETFKIAKNVIKIHPEVKTIYLGLDFFRFLERNKDNKRDVIISDNHNLTISEFNPLILSFNTTLASINTVIGNINSGKNEVSNIQNSFKSKLKQYAAAYSNASLSIEEIKKIKEFKKAMNIRGYDVILYTNPVHVLDFVLLDKMGYLPLFFEWKELMAAEFEYIDFAIVNELTTEPVSGNTKYFHESSHATSEMGNFIIDELIFGIKNYAFYVSSSNVNNFNTKTKDDLKCWEIKNIVWNNEIENILSGMESK